MPAKTFAQAANDLRTVHDRIPNEVKEFMRAAKVEVETVAANKIRTGARPKAVGIYSDGPTLVGDKVEVQFQPRYIARWQEGGTKAHDITRSDKVRYRNVKSAVRASRRAATSIGKVETMLITGRDQKGNTLSSRRRAGLEKRRAVTMSRQASSEERATGLLHGDVYLGPLAIGKRAAHGNVAQGTPPDTNFAASVHHPGEKPTRPLRRALTETAPRLAPTLARRVNSAWAKGIV